MVKQVRTMELDEITSYFQDLGDELARRGFQQPVRIAIFGGVFMLIEVKNRSSTQDVDIALLDLPEMTRADAPPETRLFQKAVRAVARKRKIGQAWLNDDGAMFFKGFTPGVELHHWQTFHLLAVYLPSKEVILVLKLMSFREKDWNDIEVLSNELCISTHKQAQDLLNDYVDGRWQREYCVDQALKKFFGEG